MYYGVIPSQRCRGVQERLLCIRCARPQRDRDISSLIPIDKGEIYRNSVGTISGATNAILRTCSEGASSGPQPCTHTTAPPAPRNTPHATLDRVKRGILQPWGCRDREMRGDHRSSAAAQRDILRCGVHVTQAGCARQRQTAGAGTTSTTSPSPQTRRHKLYVRPTGSRCTC